LVDKVAVSDLCDEYKLQPSVLYGWLKQLTGNLGVALEAVGGKRKPAVNSTERELQRENDRLKEKLAKRDHVIAEISEEHVRLKKELGEP
jgi:molybdopterin converting factor small subunit